MGISASIKNSVVEINEWLSYLKEIESDSSNKWVCEVKTGTDFTIGVIAKDKLDANCEKLSFGEIVSVSTKFMHYGNGIETYGCPLLELVRQKASRLGITGDLEYQNEIKKFGLKKQLIEAAQKILSICTPLGKISKSLMQIHDRSKNKRTEMKTASIWGRVKWCIWSWFYDKESQIKEVENWIKINHKWESVEKNIDDVLVMSQLVK